MNKYVNMFLGMNKYVNMFLGLRCSGDVLNAVSKLNDASKEITESMAIIQRLKSIVLSEPMKYTIVDLCAGNALTSVLSVHMLPVKEAYAVDRKKRKGNYDKAQRFTYIERDINDIAFNYTEGKHIILIAVHPCKTANNIIDIFNQNQNIKHLIMMPCCNDTWNDFTGAG